MSSLFPDYLLPGLTDWVRHTHKTIANYLEQQLTVNGWVSAPVNFGATPVTFEEVQPEQSGTTLKPNTVSILVGDVPEQQLEQLGGGLYSLAIPIFVDIYGEKISISLSIADDVRRLLTDRAFAVYDFTNPAVPVALPGVYVEFERVIGPRTPAAAAEASADLRRNWRVVRATATTYFTSDF